MAQCKSCKKYKRLRFAKDHKPSTKEEMDNKDEEDTKLYKPGELLSCDNVGPVNLKSFEGYTQTFIWREAHVLTLGQRSNRGSIPRGTGRDTSVCTKRQEA